MRSILQRRPSNLALSFTRIEAHEFLWSTSAPETYGVTILTESTPEHIQAVSGALRPLYVSGADEDGIRSVMFAGPLDAVLALARSHNPNDVHDTGILRGLSEDRILYDLMRRIEFGLNLHFDFDRANRPNSQGYVHDFAVRSAATHAMTTVTTMRGPARSADILSVPVSLYGFTMSLRYGSDLGTPMALRSLAEDTGCSIYGSVMPTYGEYLDVVSAELEPVMEFLEALMYGDEKPLTADPLTMARLRSVVLAKEKK